MSDCQSIPVRLPGVRYFVKRSSGIGAPYSAGMKQKARTEYGMRLFTARKHADLTQTTLAKDVGMSQSAYQEAETTGLKSTYTAQLAARCGVNPQWLATGEGSMLSGQPDKEASEYDLLADALKVLTKALQKSDKNARIALEPLLASMAKEPSEAPNKSRLILSLLVTKPDSDSQSDDRSTTRISGELGVLDLGDNDGRSDRIAATGGSKQR